MPFIKKLVMHGFKSFARKTEVPLTPEINCVLGPNGSGKSNVTDALCFVLGRLSAKSMRAAKAKNLIFMGTKSAAPAKEASVELIFDNQDRGLPLDTDEISIKRIVRKNGQSIYKINNETKTRQDLLTVLVEAGIDPNGFNIILQGEIQNFVKMHTEERRKIVEEVSGISVYESRKHKSMKELEKTEEKLKEVIAVLRERTAYLQNLEKERQQALKYQKLQADIKKLKASIIQADLNSRKKQQGSVLAEIEKKQKESEKIKKKVLASNNSIKNFEDKISEINSTIQNSTGLEQEKLNQEIANLRAELAGLNVKLENHETKMNQNSRQEQELKVSIRDTDLELVELHKESPTIAKKQKEIDAKKKELERLEAEKKKHYMMKSELKSAKERFEDKRVAFQNLKNESDFVIKQMELLSRELYDKKTTKEKIESLKADLEEKKEMLSDLDKREREIEKQAFLYESEIEKNEKLVNKISKIDICPVCKSKITEDHIHSINQELAPKSKAFKSDIEKFDKEMNQIHAKRGMLKQEIENLETELSRRSQDLLKILSINEKKEQIKIIQEKSDALETELKEIQKRKDRLEKEFDENSNIEKKYETVFIEVQEISLRSEENVNSEISFKQRELERLKISLKQVIRDRDNYKEEIAQAKKSVQVKNEELNKKRKKEEEIVKKFNSFIDKRDKMQSEIRKLEINLQNENRNIQESDNRINNLKIDKARVDAEIDNLETEFLEFEGQETIKANKESLAKKLAHTQEIISRIGSVNLRSLEVYDSIKEEYDAIREKVDTISKEKEGIMKIIHEIDIKKKKTFLKTLGELNDIFARNFAQISTKGQVSLELENRKEPFEGGVAIMVKTGHGKYFDVTSLSGGEQTMVALSLIFAIQELNPYCFYILDEIDAALDKRNSERLANLLKKYMQKGQYIVITHNDEIIMSASTIYGVSMHDGVSKIVSMKV